MSSVMHAKCQAALLLAGKSLNNNFTQILLSDVTDTLRLLMILVWVWLQTDSETDRRTDRELRAAAIRLDS